MAARHTPPSTEEARQLADRRHSHERGAVSRHVDSVVKRAGVLTDEERTRLAVALVARTRAAQQLPEHVEDPAVLVTVANIIAGPTP